MAKKSGVSGSVRRRIFKRDSYRCALCGLAGWEMRCPRGGFIHPTSAPGIYLSIDHIAPRSRGGGHGESNLRTLCTLCNSRKGTS